MLNCLDGFFVSPESMVTTNKQKPLLQLHTQKSKSPLNLWVHLHEDKWRRAAAEFSSTKNPLKNKQFAEWGSSKRAPGPLHKLPIPLQNIPLHSWSEILGEI
jgi:hypothetical protein